MPQLRDSSNSSTAVSNSLANESAQQEQAIRPLFERIFGIETEYGISVTGSQKAGNSEAHRAEAGSAESISAETVSAETHSAETHTDSTLDASHVASVMFEPIMSQSRSTNTYTENGSRIYLDVGSHPEYATAEARTVTDAVLLDAAGENLMAALAHQAERTLREHLGNSHIRVHMYKNNTDSQGHSFGCHENYLVRRTVDLSQLDKSFIPFLVTRQIFAGAGVVRDGQFQMSQRADFLDDTISSATTRSRPMINTRDEPHADSRLYRRLHVIVGDSNRSERATWMKMMTAHIVLSMIEAQSRGEDYGLAAFELANAGEAARLISRDVLCETQLELADGRMMTALDIQRGYHHAAANFMTKHALDFAEDMRQDVTNCLETWDETLQQVEAHDFDALSTWVDWAAKYQLICKIAQRGGGKNTNNANAKMLQFDFAYHDIAHDDVFRAVQTRGKVTPLFSSEEIRKARHTPPHDTRAYLRGQFVSVARKSSISWSADWTSVTVVTPHDHRHVTAHTLDPFDSTGNDEYRSLMQIFSERNNGSPMLPLI